MRSSTEQSEYTKPGAEFSPPPEQSATLSGKRRFADRFGGKARRLAEADEPELQASERRTEAPPDDGQPGPEAAASAAADKSQAAEHMDKRKRSLLLQFAAVASSVVLVTNSFGLDFLGLDGLFNDSVILGEVSESSEYEPEPTHDSEPEAVFSELMPFGGDRIFPRLSSEWTVSQDATIDAHNRYIVTVNFAKGEMKDRAKVEGFVRADRKTTGYSGPIDIAFPDSLVMINDPSITYDENSNTLTLRNYHGKGLIVNNMGQDFTIRLEGDSVLSQYLLVGGGSLTLTGSGGITINDDEEFTYGIHLEGGFSEACLMIEDGVKFNIGGAYSVFRVSKTCASKGMWQISPQAWQNTYQGKMIKEDISRYSDDPNHYYSWLLCGSGKHSTIVHLNNGYRPGSEDSTQPVETAAEPSTEAPVTITRLPVGGDSAFPILPNPMPDSVGADGQTHASQILVWENFKEDGSLSVPLDIYSYQQNHPTGRDDISYDPASNTLTLNNYSGGRLDVRSMGSSFKIRLIGRNELMAGMMIFGDLTSGSVTFTGDGYLALNSPTLSLFGIFMDAGGAAACVMIDSSVTMDIYGSSEAVTVQNTSADKAIYYLSDVVTDLQQARDGGESAPSVPGTFYDWKTVDGMGGSARHIHLGGEVPPETETEPDAVIWGLPVGGDSAFPDLPNPDPNTPVPGYGVINEDYVLVTDRDADTYGFIYFNSYYNEMTVSRDGISYDPATNTLTLNNYQGKGISANLLGNGLTVELIGESELTQGFEVWGFYTGGSIHFTGNGSLTINSSKEQIIGLQLYAEFSTSCVMIDKSVTLDIYGESNAVEVRDTNAEQAIYLLSDSPIEGVRQYVVSEELPDNEAIEQVPYQFWHLVDNDGFPVKHLHVEGSNSILDWFGR